jgi:hypothetical protein
LPAACPSRTNAILQEGMSGNLQVFTLVQFSHVTFFTVNLHGADFFYFSQNLSIKAPSYYHLFRLIAFYLSFLRYSFVVNVPKLGLFCFQYMGGILHDSAAKTKI